MQIKSENMRIGHNFLGGLMNNFRWILILLFSISFMFAKEKKVTISGTVQDSQGLRVKKAIVLLLDENGEEIKDSKTGKKGDFKFKKVTSGDYTLSASHKTLGDVSQTIAVSGENLSIDLILTHDLTEKESTEIASIDTGGIISNPIKGESQIKIESNSVTSEKGKQSLLSNLKKPSDPLNVIHPDSIVILPPIRKEPDTEKLQMGQYFYEYKMNLEAMQNQIDSLKSVVTAFEQKQTMPNISEDILNLIKVPDYEHRIELQNGTVIMGHILLESDSSLTIDTQIGKLVLKKEMVIRMDELERPAPHVEFVGEPMLNQYPDRQIFTGKVKNTGKVRADFVRVIGQLWTQTTSSAGTDSIFVKGSRIKYETGVVSDTSLEPGQTTSYKLTIPIKRGTKPQYHTMDIHWDVTK